jgi:hypothetical protein
MNPVRVGCQCTRRAPTGGAPSFRCRLSRNRCVRFQGKFGMSVRRLDGVHRFDEVDGGDPGRAVLINILAPRLWRGETRL